VEVADAIKTLDMSLPSYGEIKGSKASIENVPSLAAPPSQGGGSVGVSTKKKKKSSGGGEGGGGGMSMSTFLPSMGKQGPKTKAE